MEAADLYSAQDVETKIVIPHLVALGYDESKSDVNGVVLRFQHPITVHQGRQKKTISADVVVFVHDSPVIVIDSKNPRDYLTEADREQVISYSRLIGDIAPYAALCSGSTWLPQSSFSISVHSQRKSSAGFHFVASTGVALRHGFQNSPAGIGFSRGHR